MPDRTCPGLLSSEPVEPQHPCFKQAKGRVIIRSAWAGGGCLSVQCRTRRRAQASPHSTLRGNGRALPARSQPSPHCQPLSRSLAMGYFRASKAGGPAVRRGDDLNRLARACQWTRHASATRFVQADVRQAGNRVRVLDPPTRIALFAFGRRAARRPRFLP